MPDSMSARIKNMRVELLFIQRFDWFSAAMPCHEMEQNRTECTGSSWEIIPHVGTVFRIFFFLVIPFEQIPSLLGVSPTCCAHFPRFEIDPFTLLFLAGFWFPSSTVDVVPFFLPSSRNIKIHEHFSVAVGTRASATSSHK